MGVLTRIVCDVMEKKDLDLDISTYRDEEGTYVMQYLIAV